MPCEIGRFGQLQAPANAIVPAPLALELGQSRCEIANKCMLAQMSELAAQIDHGVKQRVAFWCFAGYSGSPASRKPSE
jgi:hypothetical protein